MFVRNFTSPFGTLPVYLAPDDGGGAGGAGGAGETGTGGDPPVKTFSQDDLDRHAGRRAAEGEKQARKALLESLGVKDEAEAKKILDAAKKAADKDRSDLDRATAKAAENETAAQTARREAADARLQLKVDRKLLAAGVDTKLLERIGTMVAVAVDADADDDAIVKAIEDIKTDFPGSFTGSEGAGANGTTKKTGAAPSGTATGGQGPTGHGKAASGLDRGRERARRYQGKTDTTKTA